MLFNSHAFLFLFLPLTFLAFFYGGASRRWRLLCLTLASHAFYASLASWASWQLDAGPAPPGAALLRALHPLRFSLLLLGSSSVDYVAARALGRLPPRRRRARLLLLGASLLTNVAVLCLFKYAGLLTEAAHALSQLFLGRPVAIAAVLLPVGISFYTFESMSYVIDVYRGDTEPAAGYLEYACFIAFFPHLVAGPLIRFADIRRQIAAPGFLRPRPDWEEVQGGLLLFTLGLCKKLLVADALAAPTSLLWDALGRGVPIGVVDSWAMLVGFTLRFYLDFSGYSDMASGLSRLFGLRLPQNFDSPFCAVDPIDFWRRWHMSLSAWLRDYVYLPLGGGRAGRRARNLMITMLVVGLWHGAAALHLVWGAWHGLLLVLAHALRDRGLLSAAPTGVRLFLRRLAVFLLVTISFVPFRAADLCPPGRALSLWPGVVLLRQLLGLGGGAAPLPGGGPRLLGTMALLWALCAFGPSPGELLGRLRMGPWQAVLLGGALALCVLGLGRPVDFLYLRF